MSNNNILSFKNPSLEKLNLIIISIFPISLLVGTLVSNFLIILICLIFIIEKRKEIMFFFKNKYICYLLLIYFYLLFNSVFIAQNLDSFIRSVGFIRYIILVIVLSEYFFSKSKIYSEFIIRMWSLVLLIVTIDLLIEYFKGKNILGFQSNYSGRLASFTSDELRIGGFYFGFIIFTLSLIYEKFKNEYFFFIFFTFFLFISLIIGERANFIKFFFLFLTIFFIFSLKNKKKFLINLILLSSLIILLIKFYPKNFNTTFYSKIKSYDIFHLLNYDKKDPFKLDKIIDNQRHFKHYIVAYNIFQKNILFGIGIKNFRYESHKEEYNNYKDFSAATTHPHQTHFEILSELGIVGYFLIIGNLFLIIFNFFKIKNKSILNKFALLYILIFFIPLLPSGSFFSSYNATIFWINYAMVVGCLIQQEKIIR